MGQKHKSVNILILQQILEEEQHQKEGIEVTEAEINTYKKIILKDTECSVCGEDLKAGD